MAETPIKYILTITDESEQFAIVESEEGEDAEPFLPMECHSSKIIIYSYKELMAVWQITIYLVLHNIRYFIDWTTKNEIIAFFSPNRFYIVLLLQEQFSV
ncbi:hypothetical protein LOAG_09914 [Loa loa]|uniref:Uncharacterized protein n=1 Tax=Loa loa TaxID=7209 RepID=A0A1S0TRH5_LOALO|nr:hypothetical protein LOAG_09914 [Loa loa]EFO18583.1 hypothetical protein LOAG_09914 [Loa loa]